jgi:hypothetical protein
VRDGAAGLSLRHGRGLDVDEAKPSSGNEDERIGGATSIRWHLKAWIYR